MKLPPAKTAPEAIRALTAILREGVAYSRTREANELKTRVVQSLQESYENAPPDEISFPVHREGAVANGPGGTFFSDSPELNLSSEETIGFVRLAFRLGRRARLVASTTPTFPETWSAEFYERLAWPAEKVREGVQPFRHFVELTRCRWNLVLPIHDSEDPWTGAKFKAKPAVAFPIELGFPFRGYLVFANKMGDRTLCRWLTVYLAQRSFLTKEEEEAAFNAFFVDGRANLLFARWKAYERIKRRFVQPIAGRPSFSTYLSATTSGLVKELTAEEQGWGEEDSKGLPSEERGVDGADQEDSASEDQGWDDADIGEPTADRQETRESDTAVFGTVPGNLVNLSRLRWRNPNLHRALLDRIERGLLLSVVRAGHTYVDAADVDRVDSERAANADARRPKRFEADQRAAWRRRLKAGGLSTSTAHRILARWINEDGLTADEIEARVAKPHRARLKPPADAAT